LLLKYSKKFPKPFSDRTIVYTDSYPEYRQQNDSCMFTNLYSIVCNNRWIVPYNLYCLQKYRAYINIEVCTTVYSVKYINSYIYKGSDCITIAVSNKHCKEYCNKIQEYVQSQYIGPTEACWQIFEYSIYSQDPSVIKLDIYLERQHTIYFRDNDNLIAICEQIENTFSILIVFFDYNSKSEEFRYLKYRQFPEYLTYNRKTWR
jgi:hypothetical protein